MAWVLTRRQEACFHLLKACVLHRQVLGAVRSEPESPELLLAAYPNPAVLLSAKTLEVHSASAEAWSVTGQKEEHIWSTLTTAF